MPLRELMEVNPQEPLPRGRLAPYLDMALIPTAGPIPADFVLREYGSCMRFRNGDALLARITPCLENGKRDFVQNLPADEVGWGSTEFIVLRSRTPVPKSVAYIVARDPLFRAMAIRSMTGTSGRQRASGEAVSAFSLIQPSNDEVWTCACWSSASCESTATRRTCRTQPYKRYFARPRRFRRSGQHSGRHRGRHRGRSKRALSECGCARSRTGPDGAGPALSRRFIRTARKGPNPAGAGFPAPARIGRTLRLIPAGSDGAPFPQPAILRSARPGARSVRRATRRRRRA